MTVGNTDKNISLGLGYGYADGEWARNPFVSMGGMVRVSQKISLVTENYLFPAGSSNIGMMSAALRWQGKNFAVDYGLVRSTEDTDIIGIPWLGVTLPFGK